MAKYDNFILQIHDFYIDHVVNIRFCNFNHRVDEKILYIE